MNAIATVPVKQAKAAPVVERGGVFSLLQREIDQLFEDFAPNARASAAEFRCRMDLAENKDGLELTVELPGLDQKDVEVDVADGVLTVRGEKRFAKEEKDKDYHFVERGYGSFARSIQLPAGVKAEDVKAVLDKGVLKVSIPTPAKPPAKKVKIETAR